MVMTYFYNKVFFFLRLAMLEREKMTEYSCLVLKLASWSGIDGSSIRKKEMRGTDDGIAEINNRSNFLKAFPNRLKTY